MAKGSRTLRYKVMMAGVLCLVIAWSVLWFVAATIVDRHAEKAEHMALTAGAMADCVNRHVGGFPFRIEVRCGPGSRVGTVDAKVQLDGMTAAALIYQPSRVIVEVQGPAVVSTNGLANIVADWDLAHASARLDISDAAMSRLDVEVVDGTVTLGDGAPLSFEELDVNIRRNPTNEADLDLSLRALSVAPDVHIKLFK
ncbi:MAG: DUF2125 domain-containing protein, partial [Pseudomonadota bacterium]